MKHPPTRDPNLILEPIVTDEEIEKNWKDFRFLAGAAAILYITIIVLSALAGYVAAKQDAQMEAAQANAQILKLNQQIQERDSIIGITDMEVEAIEAIS